MKLKALYDNQIDRIFNKKVKYGGIMNRLLLKNIKNKFYILNMDNKNQGGTHWVLLWNCNKSKCYYMDPFGAPPPENIEKLMKKTKKDCIYSDIDLQDLNSESCGWMCIYFALQLLNKRSFLDILMDDFTINPKQNELILEKYFS